MSDNGVFTLQNLLYAVLTGGSFAGIISVVGAWLAKRSELRHADTQAALAAQAKERVEFSAAQVQERTDIRRAYQDIIESLKNRIQDSEKDRERLWSHFREMQVALAECENLHRGDQKKITSLERQIAQQAKQISDLRRHVSGPRFTPEDE